MLAGHLPTNVESVMALASRIMYHIHTQIWSKSDGESVDMGRLLPAIVRSSSHCERRCAISGGPRRVDGLTIGVGSDGLE